jgi:DNA ligase (NAD+)
MSQSLNQSDPQSKINALRSEIEKHNQNYYQNAKTEISDYEYDQLKYQLEDLESKYPEFTFKNSPSLIVGDDRNQGFERHTHLERMMSLDNTYNQEELYAFNDRLEKVLNKKKLSYAVEPKIDGVAISLTYTNGNLIRATTRGNGIEGDDVTRNIKNIPTLPPFLLGSNLPQSIEIRGEVFMNREEFIRINTLREEQGQATYANPRNLAAGTLKLLDPKQSAGRSLQIVLYGIGFLKGSSHESQIDWLKQIKKWGLPCLEKFWESDSIESAWQGVQELDKIRRNFSYDTDGAVIKLNDIQSRSLVGETAKSPKWAISYKFESEKAETLLKKIELQVGRTGVVTPVAHLEPVLISGSTVSRATLHNEDEIKRKDLRIGDRVLIEKAGEIIPQVVQFMPDSRKDQKAYTFPNLCPSCNNPLKKADGEVAWRCHNIACGPQIRGRIIHFASKNSMDIENLGIAIVDQLVSKKVINSIADLYSLEISVLKKLDKFADKSAKNLLDALEKSKNKEPWRLLHGLGIPGVGMTISKDLIRKFKNIDTLIQQTQESLLAIDGIGPILADNLIAFFENVENIKVINLLKAHDLTIALSEETNSSNLVFENLTIVLTGTLPTLSRIEATEMIENAGGKTSGSVSKKTAFVLAGEASGSKFKKAEKLGIPIMDEESFLNTLKPS